MGLRIVTYSMLGLILLPLGLILATSVTTANYVAFPPVGFSFHGYTVALKKWEYVESFGLSLWIAVVAAAIATALGTLVALGLVRYRFQGRDIVNAFFMSPLILPTVVIGIALLQFYSWVGLAVSPVSLILGHVIITTPYAIRLVATSLTGFDLSIERAARNLGATPFHAFVQVTLPLIRPGIIAGGIFAFITSFDNITISVFLATPTMVTLPVRIYSILDQPIEPWLVALCSLVILWTGVLLWMIERTVGLQGLFGAQDRP
jgi:putative spermidine/putrescine transport system permease protein